jgi:hypothetical protein
VREKASLVSHEIPLVDSRDLSPGRCFVRLLKYTASIFKLIGQNYPTLSRNLVIVAP